MGTLRTREAEDALHVVSRWEGEKVGVRGWAEEGSQSLLGCCLRGTICVRCQVIAYLQQREDDLMFQVNNLQQQLDATMSRTMEVGVVFCCSPVYSCVCVVVDGGWGGERGQGKGERGQGVCLCTPHYAFWLLRVGVE
jgi:hypothetical protein